MHGRFHGIFVENISKYIKPVKHFHKLFDNIIVEFIHVFFIFFYSMKSSIILLAVLGTALAEVFLEERFADGKYTNINT